jgi:hypothetical protein
MTVAHKTLRIGVDVGGTNTYVSVSLLSSLIRYITHPPHLMLHLYSAAVDPFDRYKHLSTGPGDDH